MPHPNLYNGCVSNLKGYLGISLSPALCMAKPPNLVQINTLFQRFRLTAALYQLVSEPFT